MNYKNRFGKYAVEIGMNTMAWFKDYDKAPAEYMFYADARDELDYVLRLVDLKTGEVLASVEPVEG